MFGMPYYELYCWVVKRLDEHPSFKSFLSEFRQKDAEIHERMSSKALCDCLARCPIHRDNCYLGVETMSDSEIRSNYSAMVAICSKMESALRYMDNGAKTSDLLRIEAQLRTWLDAFKGLKGRQL